MIRVLDLFSGIGGFSLGLERTKGFETVAFCEIEPHARRVLAKHWPEVPIYDDVTTLSASRLEADGIAVDAICGGFPCQDISNAGNGAGLEGERSGLWFEFRRLIDEIRPAWVFIENVSALRSRGLEVVLGGLAALGYDAEWHCIPASAVGAPHQRDRVWIVAHTHGKRELQPQGAEQDERRRTGDSGGEIALADAQRVGQPGPGASGDASHPAVLVQRKTVDALNGSLGDIWRAEPDVGRVANGVPSRVDRLRCLGNAVVPQIPQILGEAVLARLELVDGAGARITEIAHAE